MVTAAEINLRSAELQRAYDPWEPLYAAIAGAGRNFGEALSKRRDKKEYEQSMEVFKQALASGPGQFRDSEQFMKGMLGVISKLPSREAQATASTFLSGVVGARKDALRDQLDERGMRLEEARTGLGFQNLLLGRDQEARMAKATEADIGLTKAQTEATRLGAFGKTWLGRASGLGPAPEAPSEASLATRGKALGVSLYSDIAAQDESILSNPDALDEVLDRAFPDEADHALRGYALQGIQEAHANALKITQADLDNERERMTNVLRQRQETVTSIGSRILSKLAETGVGSIEEYFNLLESVDLSALGVEEAANTMEALRDFGAREVARQAQVQKDAASIPGTAEFTAQKFRERKERIQRFTDSALITRRFSQEDMNIKRAALLASLANNMFGTLTPDQVKEVMARFTKVMDANPDGGPVVDHEWAGVLRELAAGTYEEDPAEAKKLLDEADEIDDAQNQE